MDRRIGRRDTALKNCEIYNYYKEAAALQLSNSHIHNYLFISVIHSFWLFLV